MGEGIRIATVTGSVRPGNFTSRALALVHDEIRNHDGITLDAIDPARMRLPPPGTDTGSVEVKARRWKSTISSLKSYAVWMNASTPILRRLR